MVEKPLGGFNWVPLALLSVGSLVILSWVLSYSQYGLDLTDEGFYLVWGSDPFFYKWSVTQFGFVYHPLYLLLNGDIANLRRANILITYVLGCSAFFLLFRRSFCWTGMGVWNRLALSSALGLASLGVFTVYNWLITPNYNTLAFQSLEVIVCGIFLLEHTRAASRAAGWLLIGVGGWLAFMAKPTTAAAAGVLVVGYLIVSKKLKYRGILISCCTSVGLLYVSALLIDGSVAKFAVRLQSAETIQNLLLAEHSVRGIFRIDHFGLTIRTWLVMLAYTGAAVGLTFLCQRVEAKLRYFIAAVFFLLFLVVMAQLFGYLRSFAPDGDLRNLAYLSALMAAVFVALASKTDPAAPEAPWALVFFLLLLPYCYAFGSANNYWRQASLASIFYVLAGATIAAFVAARMRQSQLFLFPLGLVVQSLTIALVYTAMENPYRQPKPLRTNTYHVSVGPYNSNLIVTEEFGKYLATATRDAYAAGFRPGTGIIDLTGQSPTLLYAIKASNVGQPWLFGGYPGSNKAALKILSSASCDELATSWILFEPEGPLRLSPNVLSAFGANLTRDYKVAAQWKTAAGAGGFAIPRSQQLLRPLRSPEAAREACREAKRA